MPKPSSTRTESSTRGTHGRGKTAISSDGPIVLFDGDCHLCNASVNFIIQRDRRAEFRYASLDSAAGLRLLARYGLSGSVPDTVVLLDGKQAFARSGAALRIAKKLKWPWPLLFGLVVIPRFARDFFYNWLARNRRKWVGNLPACVRRDFRFRERFLDGEPPPE